MKRSKRKIKKTKKKVDMLKRYRKKEKQNIEMVKWCLILERNHFETYNIRRSFQKLF